MARFYVPQKPPAKGLPLEQTLFIRSGHSTRKSLHRRNFLSLPLLPGDCRKRVLAFAPENTHGEDADVNRVVIQQLSTFSHRTSRL
jgi:hypothetical protein